MTADALTRTSSMVSHLTALTSDFDKYIPRGMAASAALREVNDCIDILERGHCGPCTLTDVGMALGRVAALSEEHLSRSHKINGLIYDAKITLWEMIRTCPNR